ncbi:hypothetical protein CPB85DRAFT_1314383 [Mucidula mucida]|nr:hypothetical protein CPB85DRAFT_1314383 [Mucidula mucida]
MASSSPEDDKEDVREGTAQSLGSNNMEYLQRFMSRKKLRTEQVTDVQVFVQDIAPIREAKMFTLLLSVSNEVNTIVVNTSPYTVSADLEKNLSAYSAGVLLSKGIASYKGKYATGHVLDVTFKLEFELPPRIQFNHSAMLKITAAAGDALTQKRSKFKKLLGVSLGTRDTKKKTLILLGSGPSASQPRGCADHFLRSGWSHLFPIWRMLPIQPAHFSSTNHFSPTKK